MKTVSKENIIDSTNSLSLDSITAPDGDDKYDPHDHRSVKNATTNWQTFAHFLKASIGTGVLAMPSAFANAGYVNGVVLTAIIGFIAVHCLHILMGSMYELCKRKRVPYLTFSEAMTVGFREGPPFFKCIIPIATPFVDGFLAFYHFGICCVYVVFIAESIKQIVDEHLVVLDARIHMCFVLVPLFLIFSIRNLKLLAPFSSFANVLLFVGFGVILYYIFDDLPPISERKAVEDLGKLPIFFGTVLFALEAVGVILAIEENMKTPKSYLKPFGILNMGMAIVLSLYVVLGFFGYWKYGDASLGSVTLNIPQEKILAQVTKILFAITTWISYALQGYVTADIIWNKYLSKRVTDTSKHVLYELLIRALLVLLTFCCAIAIPDLSLFLSLVGSFCLSILGLIFPALLQICVQYRTGYGPWKIRLTKNILLVAFGCLGGVVGTYVSIVEIVQAYSKTVSKENIIDSTNSLSLGSITAPDGDDKYDPHDHRSVKNATTNWQTFAHFLKASIGTGVLAMPSAFANAGYVNGFVLTAIIGFIAVHCLHILMGSMYELCKRKRVPYLTFSKAMTVGFREGPPLFKCIIPIATPFVDGFLAFYHFGICCVYVVFIAESIKQIVDEHLVVLDARIHMCFVLVPLFLIFSIRNLKLLAPFSSFANVLLFVGFGVILYYIFDDLPPISERKAVEDLGKLPIFFGTVLFALEGVGVILAIEENMKTPKSYLKPFGILNMGMAIVLSLYVVLGFFGYWKYGDASLGSVTLNIPQEKILAQVTKILFAITTWISYALQGYVTAHIIWNKYLSKRVTDTSKHVLYELLIRALLVLLTFCCAIAIPDLSLFLSLVGSFCLSILGLICPALLQICVQYRTGYGPWKIRLTKNILLVAFGCLGGVVGTYVSIVEIVQAYSK